MYALLSQNQNYVIERKSEARVRLENKKIENLNLEIKSKIDRLKNFDEEALFSMSEDSSFDEKEEIKKIKYDDSLTADSKRLDTFASAQLRAEGKGNFVTRKIYCYKFVVKWLDVITTVLLAISTLTAQIENLHFYDLNLKKRQAAITVVKCILSNNFSTYNATYIDQVMNQTDYLSTINTTDYHSVYVNLDIDKYSEQLRYFIVIMTLISCGFIAVSRWSEYVREYIYRTTNEIPFVKTAIFWIMTFEILLVLPIQYPSIKGYLLYREFGSPLLIPYSSLLAVFCLLRVYFLIKLFKHLTRWTSPLSEYICERYVCKANTSFAFKAFQKENPFVMLFFIFILSCYCFGMGVRVFELYYWENFAPSTEGYQNWNYQWNAMWFIFVSMTTVGYGDFVPKTQFGRGIAIFACLVGVYFVSMMMVFMTQKSLKSEKEEKAFKLITRLKYRNLNKNLQSSIIFNFFTIVNMKKTKGEEMNNKSYDIQSKYLRRCIINLIWEIKENNKYIKSCDFIPTKEQLFDISEKLDSDIKDIKNEFESLRNINASLKTFTEDQLEIVDYLKKNLYGYKAFYGLVQSSDKFGKLSTVTESLDSILNSTNQQSDSKEEGKEKEDPTAKRRMTNPQQWDPKPLQKLGNKKQFEEEKEDSVFKENNESNNQELLAVNEFDELKVKLYFDFMYAKERFNPKSPHKSRSRLLTDKFFDRSIRKEQIQKKLTKITKGNDSLLDADDLTPSNSSSNSSRSEANK